MSLNLARCGLLVACIAIAGCGSDSGFPKTYPVTGSIKVKGKPISGAMVTFQLDSGKENAIGTTDSNGEFSLSMFQPGDGAIPGQYRVAVSKLADPGAKPNTPPPGQLASGDLGDDYAPPTETPTKTGPTGPKSEIPAQYSNDQTSGLRVTVTESGPNKFDLDLK